MRSKFAEEQLQLPYLTQILRKRSCLQVLIKGEEDFHLRDYEIFPMGNYSFIRVLATGAELPLYGSGGFKPFGQKKFDEAICAFLNCFCQWQTHIEVYLKITYFPCCLVWYTFMLNCAACTENVTSSIIKAYQLNVSINSYFFNDSPSQLALFCLFSCFIFFITERIHYLFML